MAKKTEAELIDDWLSSLDRAPEATLSRIIGRIRSSVRNASYGDPDHSPGCEKAAS